MDINQIPNNDKNLSVVNILINAKNFFNTDRDYPSLTKYLEKTAKGSELQKPKHVFLIIGESLDTWPLQDKYHEFSLTPNLDNFIAKGVYFKYFLPCAYLTMLTINTVITGVMDTGLHINYQKNGYSTFPTALATQFGNMGFECQFFYGGNLSWQRLGEFALSQGFSKVYGEEHIINRKTTNEWGIDDRSLFRFIENNIRKAKTPTFNVIMTTSNHPTYSINLEQEGFNKEKTAKLC